MKKQLRCMAYKSGEVYIAVCLDLSLAAQADSMKEAIEKLDKQVKDYLREAYADKKYTRQMLDRSAPFALWLKYYLFRILLARTGNTKNKAFFKEESCPA